MASAAGARCHGDELRSPWRQLHGAVGDQRRSAAAAGRSAWLRKDRLSCVDGCPRRPATRIPQQHRCQVGLSRVSSISGPFMSENLISFFTEIHVGLRIMSTTSRVPIESCPFRLLLSCDLIPLLMSILVLNLNLHEVGRLSVGPFVLFGSSAVLDPRVAWPRHGVLSPFIPVLCHSDWLFHGESCPRVDVVHPVGLGPYLAGNFALILDRRCASPVDRQWRHYQRAVACLSPRGYRQFVHSVWTDLNKSIQLHDAFIGHSRQRNDLIGCIETRSVRAQRVLNTYILMQLFTLEFAKWSLVQFSLCAVKKPFLAA